MGEREGGIEGGREEKGVEFISGLIWKSTFIENVWSGYFVNKMLLAWNKARSAIQTGRCCHTENVKRQQQQQQ